MAKRRITCVMGHGRKAQSATFVFVALSLNEARSSFRFWLLLGFGQSLY